MTEGKPIPAWRLKVRQARRFLMQDAWTAELSSISGIKNLLIRLLRVGQLVIKGFREDNLPLHAAALTFMTLMSMVPVLAIVFALLKGLGADKEARLRLLELMDSMPEQFQTFIQQILDIADRTNFLALGWVGLLVLFVAVIQVLGSIEKSLNVIWGLTASRTFLRRAANYISVTVAVPILIMAATAITASMSNEAFIQRLGEAAFVYRGLLRLAPLLTVWLAFFLLYVLLPNTTVRRSPAAISAFITSLLWISWQKLYIAVQVGVSQYNAIYGTFASVPIFLAWLYISWVIVLLGAELAFAIQNHSTFHMERAAGHASIRARLVLALSVVLDAARAFGGQRPALNAPAYASEKGVPIRLLNDTIRLLVKGGLLAEMADQPDTFMLIKAPDRIRAKEIIDLVMREGSEPGHLGLGRVDPLIEAFMDHVDAGVENAKGNAPFSEWVQRREGSP